MLKNLTLTARTPLILLTLILCLPSLTFALPFFGKKEQPYVWNLDFTINFFQPDEDWPVEKLFNPAEKQVYQQYGRPDAFRILYDREGRIKARRALALEYKAKSLKNVPAFTWVYLNRNEEVVFSGQGFYTQPLTDEVKLALQSGDPENVKQLPDDIVEWTYYSTGKIYRLYKGKVISTKEFPAMGAFNK